MITRCQNLKGLGRIFPFHKTCCWTSSCNVKKDNNKLILKKTKTIMTMNKNDHQKSQDFFSFYSCYSIFTVLNSNAPSWPFPSILARRTRSSQSTCICMIDFSLFPQHSFFQRPHILKKFLAFRWRKTKTPRYPWYSYESQMCCEQWVTWGHFRGRIYAENAYFMSWNREDVLVGLRKWACGVRRECCYATKATWNVVTTSLRDNLQRFP